GERDGDSAETAMSDMRLDRLAGKSGLIKPHVVVAEAVGQPHIGGGRTAFRLTAHPRGRPCLIGGSLWPGSCCSSLACWKWVGPSGSNIPRVSLASFHRF